MAISLASMESSKTESPKKSKRVLGGDVDIGTNADGSQHFRHLRLAFGDFFHHFQLHLRCCLQLPGDRGHRTVQRNLTGIQYLNPFLKFRFTISPKTHQSDIG